MIKLTNLKKSFEKKMVVNNLNLFIDKGDKIAIIGPSGCGKSTLLRLILGLQSLDGGSIKINDTELTQLSFKELSKLRQKFGLLFQSSALFDSMNVFENVAFGLIENLKLSPKEIKKIVKEKLKLVEMPGTENLMPSELSGGMKKRIGLARAIATEPEIMLYDEPTTGLDPIRSKNIEHLINKLNRDLNITSIVITHQISTMLNTADKIYLMAKGRLLEPETPDSIFHSKKEEMQIFINGGEHAAPRT
ncbi:MAG: ATP-binding cassette domain-containing protein [Candidatus Margulisiibacteriota bacterium]|jgi:phospholipid/cholesterol/gamma-HCH transport system ATP-binding protein